MAFVKFRTVNEDQIWIRADSIIAVMDAGYGPDDHEISYLLTGPSERERFCVFGETGAVLEHLTQAANRV